MKTVYIIASAAAAACLFAACAAVGELLPGGEAQATELGGTIIDNAPALAEQVGLVTTLLTHNPSIGEAVATVLAGIAAFFAAKKVKNGIKNGKNGK